MLNISGETMFNSNVYASIKLPIFHWGARFKSTAAQKAILLGKQYALQDKQDQISKEVAKAWTSLTENPSDKYCRGELQTGRREFGFEHF